MEEKKESVEQDMSKWLEEEQKKMDEQSTEDFLPALKIPSGTPITIDVDFSKPFGEWESEGKFKALIPVSIEDGTGKSERFTFWLNKRNPLYKEIIQKGRTGQTKFSFVKTGSQSDTKFIILK